MPNPKPHAGFDLLGEVETALNAARGESLEVRMRVGADMNAKLKQYANTPAVVALRRRIYTEVLEIDDNNLSRFPPLMVDTTEPEGPTEPVTGHVILIYTPGDDQDEPEPAEAFHHNGTWADVNQAGATLATLRGVEYQVLEVKPFPEILTAQGKVDAARAVLASAPADLGMKPGIHEVMGLLNEVRKIIG